MINDPLFREDPEEQKLKLYEELQLRSKIYSEKIQGGFKGEVIQLVGKNILIRHDPSLPEDIYLFVETVKVNPGALDYIFTFGSAPESA